MQCLVFDDRGEIWDAKSPGLADGLSASIGGEALTTYAIKNLGFIAANISNDSLRIRLRPAVVSQIALSSLLYWLHDQPFHRVLLSLLDGEWSHELLRTRGEAAARLLSRVKVNLDDRLGDFLNKPKPLHDLPHVSPLRALLNAWSDCNGKYDRERLAPLLEKGVNGRFVLVEAAQSSPSLFIKDVGSGFTTVGKYWLSRSIGQRVEDQPDYAYGKWVAGLYRQVLSTGEPGLEEVDAVIAWPDNPRRSYRYRRLIVPFESGPTSTKLLAATLVDQNIDLRVKSS